MSMMQWREYAVTKMSDQWPMGLFRGPSSLGKVFRYAAFAAMLGGGSLFLMIAYGLTPAGVFFLMAAVVALAAHGHWLRLREAREQRMLPERILCPKCEASIVLSADQRRECRFDCPTCGEDFEIVDEEA